LVKKIKPVLEKELSIDCKKKENVLLAVLCFGDIWQASNNSTTENEILCLDLSPDVILSFKETTIKALRTPSSDITEKLELQLIPKHKANSDWLKLNGHNPRLIIKLKSCKSISFIINHLMTKWIIEQKNFSLYPLDKDDISWNIADKTTLSEVYQYLDSPHPFQLNYSWDLTTVDEPKTDTEAFLSSFYVQKHKEPEVDQVDSTQFSSASLSGFVTDLSTDGFGHTYNEERSCKQFYLGFENSNENFDHFASKTEGNHKQTEDSGQKYKKYKKS